MTRDCASLRRNVHNGPPAVGLCNGARGVVVDWVDAGSVEEIGDPDKRKNYEQEQSFVHLKNQNMLPIVYFACGHQGALVRCSSDSVVSGTHPRVSFSDYASSYLVNQDRPSPHRYSNATAVGAGLVSFASNLAFTMLTYIMSGLQGH